MGHVNRSSRHARRGFTLIEIMIVIAIIGVLASIAVPSFQEARKRSNQRACYANQKVVIGALVQYNLDFNTSYVESPIQFDRLVSQGYLQEVPQDPGGGAGSHTRYELDPAVQDSIFCTTHGPIEAR